MIRNVIFDWSGTLVDDLPAVWHASNHVFRQAGVGEMSLDRFRAEFRLPFQGFYEQYVAHVPLPDLEAWFHQRFVEVQDTVVPLPYAREFLAFCRERGLRTLLLSAVHPRHYAEQARVTGFGDFLDLPVLGVSDKRLKIRELLETHGCRPEETLFVGDMEHDVEAARHGGVHSVAVLTGYNSLEQLRAARPDRIVEHLGELQNILESNGMQLSEPEGAGRPRYPIPTVGGLVFDDRGRVLLVRTAKWSNRWGIPGGKIEWGEESGEALRREMREETALEVTDLRFVCVQDAVRPPEFYREAHFLLLNYTCRARGTQEVRLNGEAQEYRWLALEAAEELDLNQPTRVLLDALRHRPDLRHEALG